VVLVWSNWGAWDGWGMWHIVGKVSYRVLVRKPVGKRPFWRPRHSTQNTIKMDLFTSRVEDMDWVHLAQDLDKWWGVVNAVMNLLVP
jgi:hypothetical protein